MLPYLTSLILQLCDTGTPNTLNFIEGCEIFNQFTYFIWEMSVLEFPSFLFSLSWSGRSSVGKQHCHVK